MSNVDPSLNPSPTPATIEDAINRAYGTQLGRDKVLGMLGAAFVASFVPAWALRDGDPTPPPADQGDHQDAPSQGEGAQTQPEEGPVEISWLDVGLAANSIRAFGTSVVLAAAGKEQFGGPSIKRGMTAFAVREAGLTIFGDEHDREVAKEEALGLAESLGIGAALFAGAETARHLEIDGTRVLEKVRTLGEGLDAEERALRPPSLEAGQDEWNSYLELQRVRTIKTKALRVVATGMVTPVGTIFAGAETANVLNDRLAEAIAEFRYAQTVVRAKSAEEKVGTPIGSVVELRTKANARAERDMNGILGAVEESWVGATNLQALPSLWGGATNAFYLMNNGVKEWAIASAYGGVIGNTLALSAAQTWLAAKLGLSKAQVLTHFMPAVVTSVGSVTQGMAEFFTNRDASMRDNEAWATRFDQMMRARHEDPNFLADPNSVSMVAEILGTLPRSFGQFDKDGFKLAIAQTVEDLGDQLQFGRANVLRYIRSMTDTLDLIEASYKGEAAEVFLGRVATSLQPETDAEAHHEFTAEETALLESQEFNDIAALLQEHREDLPGLPHAIVRRFVEAGQAARINELLDVVLAIARKTEITEAQRDLLRTAYGESGGDMEVNERIAAISLEAEQALAAGDTQTFGAVLGQLKSLPITNATTRDIIERLEQTLTHALTSDPHAGEERGLGETTKEVMKALLTQLTASGPLTVVISKIIELTGEDVNPVARNTLILSLGIVTTTFADNIVAYLSTEASLLRAYENKYGKEVFVEYPELKKALTRAAYWLMTNGGNSNIGSLATLLQKAKVPVYDEETGTNKIVNETFTLGSSLFRPVAAVDSLLILLGSLFLINQQEPKPKDKETTQSSGQPANPGGGQPSPAQSATPASSPTPAS